MIRVEHILFPLMLALKPIAATFAKLGMLDERGLFRLPPGMSDEEAARIFAEAFPKVSE